MNQNDKTVNFWKRVLLYSPVFLIFFVSLIITASCKNATEKIIIWTSLRPTERDLLNQHLQGFSTRFPQYRFAQLFYAPEEARTNFIVSALAGKGPALLHGASDNIGPMVELGVIQPLENFFDSTFTGQFLQKPFPANSWFQGHLYQIADRIGNHLCLVYNKDLVPVPPQTISELITMGQALTVDENGDGRPERYALAWNYTEPFFAVPFIGGYGGWIFDENYQPTLNSTAVAKAARLIYDLANTHQIIPRECDYEIANALFKDRAAAMIINGPWSWATYLQDSISIGIARIPLVDETGLWPTPLVSPMGYVMNVNETGERRQVIIELIKFLTSDEVQLSFTALSGSIPASQTAYDDSLVSSNELICQAIDQMQVGRPMPVITEMRWVWDAMRPAYQGIFTGRVSAEQAAQEMQFLAEKLIRENRQ